MRWGSKRRRARGIQPEIFRRRVFGRTDLILVFAYFESIGASQNKACTDYAVRAENGTRRANGGRRNMCEMPQCVGSQAWALEGNCAYGRNQCNIRFPP